MLQHRGRARAAPARRDACISASRLAAVVGDAVGQPLAGRRPPAPARDCPRSVRPAGSRRRGSCPAARPSPSTTSSPVASPSSRSASVRHTARGVPSQLVVMARREQEQRGGHARAPARSTQPSRRSGIGPDGVHAGSTNVSSVERWPAATISLSTPENVTATPSTNISPTASHGMRRHQRAERDQDGAVDAEAAVGQRARGPVAGEVDDDQQRDRSEDREQRRLRIARDGEADAPRPTGTTIAARTARRSASCSGSRSRTRSTARRHRPAGSACSR